MFKAVLIEKDDAGYRASVQTLDDAALPEGNVSVRVSHSTLNYKDALAITGQGPVVRKFPMVPGIDLVGVVAASQHPDYQPGDAVLLNGWGVGESHWGGLAQQARLNGDWLIPLPAGLTAQQAMAIGTAGYTAMLCVMTLERYGVQPKDGEVLVTGAAGGVGSVAVALLSQLGYRVTAMTGRLQDADYLRALGAAEVIERGQYAEPGKPLGKERWAGAVDVAGGHVLANVCASMQYQGVVTACGLAAGMALPATAAPAATGLTTRLKATSSPSTWVPTSSSPTSLPPRTACWWPATSPTSPVPPTWPPAPNSPAARPPRTWTA